jgi:CBS domain-containing protein
MMSADVIKVESGQSVDDALVLMRDNRIRHLPVIDDATMVGFLSMRDLMVAKLEQARETVEFLKDQVHSIDKPLPM